MPHSIHIPVDAEAMQAYQTASLEDRQRIQTFLSLWLKGLDRQHSQTLDEVMEDTGRKASERGLRPEILDDLLSDE